MKFNAVFFDLDGTLVNSLEDLAVSTNYVLTKMGYPTHKTECFKYFAGDGSAKMLERAMPKEEVTPERVMKLNKMFLEHYSEHFIDNTVAYDGLNVLISNLKEKEIKLAVVTNKAQHAAELVVHKLYGDAFDYILGLREGIPAKPDPTGVFMAMKELQVEPSECVFVGDTAMDIAVGVNAGIFPIGVLWGFRKEDELLKAGAKAIVSDSKQLEKIILGEL